MIKPKQSEAMIWIPMSVAILLYLLRVSKGLALPLGLWLHHMNIMELIKIARKRVVELRKHVYHLQIPAFLLLRTGTNGV